MKQLPLPAAVCAFLLAACGPSFVNPETQPFLLKASDVPESLPLPTVEYQFLGNTFSEKTGIVEEQKSATGGRYVVYGFATSIGSSSSDAALSVYYKGREGGNDQWVAQWDSDGKAGKETFIYQQGTTRSFVDTEKFKLSVR